MYPQQAQQQHHYQVMDTSNNNNNNNHHHITSNTIPYLPPPSTSNISNYNNNINNNNSNQSRHQQIQAPPPLPPHHHHQQQHYIVPPEPTPNATDGPITQILSINQLADFASTMVYLMWHARRPSVMALHEYSKFLQATTTQTDDGNLGHSKETANIANRTSSAFKKFCKQILSATQLSESVILLSLKYIAMLLQNSPSINGADGSEYRLFTVALMLANKFLDDNTFTNKTWSEVSGMKVTDLNIMELEFLDVLQFQLFIRNDEYERWKSAVLLFRSQLLNADEAQKQEQQQHLLEETFQGIVMPNIQQQQQQQQQQQHQQYQFLLMLSKAQLPQLPTQPLNRPLTRVPLRIPLQPVWRNVIQQQQQQQQQQQNVQTPMYDVNNIPQQQQAQRPYVTASTAVTPTSMMNTNNPSSVIPTPPEYYTNYHSTPADSSGMYQNYNTSSSSRQQVNYSQPVVSSAPITSNVGSRLSGIPQDYTNNYANPLPQTSSTPYYKMTPTSATSQQPIVSMENSYYNRNPYSTPQQQQQQPPLRTRNSFYNELQHQPTTDYSSYDMSGTQQPSGQSTNDLYARVSTAGYQQQPTQQQYRPPPPIQLQQQQMYNANPRKYNGPMPEDPLTAADSYRHHLK